MTNTTTNAAAPQTQEGVERSRRARLWRQFLRTPVVVMAAGFLLLLVVAAVLAPQISPHDPIQPNLQGHPLQAPVFAKGGTWTYPLGTDSLGRDLLSRIIYGARISLTIGAVAVLFSGLLGTLLGLLAGFYGGWIDTVLMRLADIQLAFPTILLVISVIAVLGPGLPNMILVLGITGWVAYARIVRSAVLVAKQHEYVQAARALGARDSTILMRHILPNLIGSIAVVATFAFAQFILTEAALSFLGLGLDPRIPTWGGILSDGRQYLVNAWWIATFPGLALMLTVLAVNLVGDWLRDMLDPSLSRL